MRGSRRQLPRRAALRRSIPASAGQPFTETHRTARREVYPRECGAAIWPYDSLDDADGLSPRVRGSLTSLVSQATYEGSIPASAGQPRAIASPTRSCQVYPRECGAANGHHVVFHARIGLSPRVAGQPARAWHRLDADEVYPRECGAATARSREVMLVWGLSPRVRGSRLNLAIHHCKRRSIPASAGQPVHYRSTLSCRGSIPASAGQPVLSAHETID